DDGSRLCVHDGTALGAYRPATALRTIAGRYEVERVVGESALSTVYAARDRATDRRVALKLMRSLEPRVADALRDAVAAVAQLSDFGVAGMLTEHADDGRLTTRAGIVAGTPAFMAPEQFLGGRNSSATDLFGLGTVLFAMLFGHAPDAGASVQELLVGRLSAT